MCNHSAPGHVCGPRNALTIQSGPMGTDLAASIPLPSGRHLSTERYLTGARNVILLRALSARGSITAGEAEQLAMVKLVYGTSPRGQLGAVYVASWRYPGEDKPGPLLSISATGQQTPLQLCVTLIHEMGHLLALLRHPGCDPHGKQWRDCCRALGHTRPLQYWAPEDWAKDFAEDLRVGLQRLPTPTDGESIGAPGPAGAGKGGRGGCSAGIGSKGGKSRAPGTNRNVSWICGCAKPARLRAARGCGLDATCNRCGQRLRPAGSQVPAPRPT